MNDRALRLALVVVAATGVGVAAYLTSVHIDAICIWCRANDVVLVPTLAVLALLRLRAEGESA